MHADQIGTRNRSAGKLAERRQCQPRENRSKSAAKQAEQGSLCKQLTDQARPARAQRGPNSELLPSSEAAGNEQVSDIRAGDEQD